MNPKRLLLAIVSVFVFVTLTDGLIHGVWLKPAYDATATLWRTETEMNARLGWMFGAHLMTALAFVMLWAKGFAGNATPKCGAIYGCCMGLFGQAVTPIFYVVMPLPPSLALKWFVAGMAQCLLLGVLVQLVYRPKPAATTAATAQ